MSKQTINIGASPNDGTGTPLRTSFDYTNQNFTELYTALGGGVGLPGATTQVIFNDGGTNLAGDAGLVYNKTTDALTVAGLVTAGSATITGALTLPAGGTSAPTTSGSTQAMTIGGYATVNSQSAGVFGAIRGNLLLGGNYTAGVSDIGGIKFLFGARSTTDENAAQVASILAENTSGTSSSGGELAFRTRAAGGNNDERLRISSTGVFTFQNVGGVAGTAMTLNSTGLGIGASPTAKLHVLNTSLSGTTAGSNVIATLRSNGSGYDSFLQFSDNVAYNAGLGMLAGNLYFYTGGAERLRIDSSGNVGIGSTSPNSRLQIVGATDDALVQSCIRFSRKGYASSTFGVSISASGGSVASQNNLVFNTSDGTNAPAERVRIDGDGNLLVGKTGNSGTVGAGIINEPSGSIWSTMTASTSASNTLLVYSTGAAAYRFYVGLGGTVNATNPVISAISDARLKENVQDIDVGLAAILSLKPRKFDWKTGKGKDIKGDRGFIAQEFETVFPNLIDEWADPAPEGEAPYKSVRQDLIPVLVKAIQELTARVQTLEAR